MNLNKMEKTLNTLIVLFGFITIFSLVDLGVSKLKSSYDVSTFEYSIDKLSFKIDELTNEAEVYHTDMNQKRDSVVKILSDNFSNDSLKHKYEAWLKSSSDAYIKKQFEIHTLEQQLSILEEKLEERIKLNNCVPHLLLGLIIICGILWGSSLYIRKILRDENLKV